MNEIAKKVIEKYLNEQKIPTIEELGVQFDENINTKLCSFVTLYKDGKVIASSGRINLKKPNTILELIENSLFCLKDPRFIEAIKNPLELKKVKFRVDIMAPDQRKIVNAIGDIDISKQGLMIINQIEGKIGVILPHMTNLTSTPQDLFELVCLKAGLNSKTLQETEYYLYTIETQEYSDF